MYRIKCSCLIAWACDAGCWSSNWRLPADCERDDDDDSGRCLSFEIQINISFNEWKFIQLWRLIEHGLTLTAQYATLSLAYIVTYMRPTRHWRRKRHKYFVFLFFHRFALRSCIPTTNKLWWFHEHRTCVLCPNGHACITHVCCVVCFVSRLVAMPVHASRSTHIAIGHQNVRETSN